MFLRLVGLIYLFAFASFYVQSEGLYGDEGILPLNNKFGTSDLSHGPFSELLLRFLQQPNLLLFRSLLSFSSCLMVV